MRRLIALIALIATPALTAGQLFAANPPPPAPTTAASSPATAASLAKGLWLLTEFPSQTLRAGEVTTVRFKLQNMGRPP